MTVSNTPTEQAENSSIILPITEETPLVQPLRKNDTSGYLYMLLSAMFESLMTFLVHVAELSFGVPPRTTLFIRGIVNTVFCAAYILFHLNPRSLLANLTPRDRVILAIRGIVGSLAVVCLFISLRHLAIGDAVTIFLTNTVFTLLLSYFVIGEPLTVCDSIAGLVGLLGIALITHQSSAKIAPDAIPALGLICATLAAALSALAFILVRLLGSKIHFMASTICLVTCTLAWSVLLGGVLPASEFIRLKEGIFISLGAACLSLMGQCCADKGLQHCRAGPGTLVRTVQVPTSYLLGLAFLNQVPTWRSFGGSCLVLAAAVVVGLRQVLAR